MRPGSGVTPGTDFHADTAVGADLSPVIETGLRIKLPSKGSIEWLGKIICGDGI